jgi:hypothetical protein
VLGSVNTKDDPDDFTDQSAVLAGFDDPTTPSSDASTNFLPESQSR